MINLCSNSQTRALILRENSIEFTQNATDFDEESLNIQNPKSFVYSATVGKFQSAIKKFDLDIPILVADTVVTTNNSLLRKANSIDEARELLLKQSDSETSIITAMIYQSRELKLIDISETKYIFDKFENSDLDSYLESNLWQGKAGAIMVEGFARKYIKEQIGYTSCAMGLTIEKLIPFLKR